MVYTVMVLIFTVIENYELGDTEAICGRIIALAGKLIGHPDKGASPWKVRKSVYLRDPKVILSGPIESRARPNQEPAFKSSEPAADSSS
jgi:hypothetical protein